MFGFGNKDQSSPVVQKGGVRLIPSFLIALVCTVGAAKLVATAELPPEIVFFAFVASFFGALFLTRRRTRYYHGGYQGYGPPPQPPRKPWGR